MNIELCLRHSNELMDQLELRGLCRPGESFDSLAFAKRAIVTHATNFAGKAAIDIVKTRACPLCFINAKKLWTRETPNGLIADNWTEHAAEEALIESLATVQGKTTETKVVLVN